MDGRPVELSIVEHPADTGLGDYERLLGDAIAGDATLFARQDVVEAAWSIVDPLIRDPGALFDYEPGSWGPPQADRLVAEIGGWNTHD
jgi:glucose-6-phosphate 1-dehydrogenase